MAWLPIGPDFSYRYRNANLRRLSRRNESGEQGKVDLIVVDPADEQTLYALSRPGSGGSALFRTRDGGRSWTAISDSLPRADGAAPFTNHVAVYAANPEVLFLGTADGRVFASQDRGDSWKERTSVGAAINVVVVDPRAGAGANEHTVFVATDSGLFASRNDG